MGTQQEFDEAWEILTELARYAGVAQGAGELGVVISGILCSQERNRHPYMEVRRHDGRRYHIVAVLDGECGASPEYQERQKQEWFRQHGLEDDYKAWQERWMPEDGGGEDATDGS